MSKSWKTREWWLMKELAENLESGALKLMEGKEKATEADLYLAGLKDFMQDYKKACKKLEKAKEKLSEQKEKEEDEPER